ncbi:MAG TPA: diiron oxygenase [Alphaproteobacteria bacterium]|nr:diiron oxygenase [Alphaproteobacteria bacterium]
MSQLDPSLAKRIEREVSLLRPTRLTPDQVTWGAGPSPDKFWVPENMVPLWGSPEYESLSDAQRLRYNQYYALQKSEYFIWLERYLVMAPLAKILAGGVPHGSLVKLLESFIADEEGHNASLQHLIVTARPDLYKNRVFYFVAPSPKFRLVTAAINLAPRTLSGWVLFAGAIEENTILTSQCYRQAGDKVDRLFAEVYMLHAQDEARHCKFDALLAEWLIADQTGWRKHVNAKVLELIFITYFDPSWGFDRPIQQLAADFPELRGRELAMIRRSQEAHAPATASILIDGAVAPLTSKNAERYDILAAAVRHLISTKPH